MKKLLLTLTLAAFAVAVQAGDDKAADKACCPPKTAKADQAKGGCCPMMSKDAKAGGCAMACKDAKPAKLASPKETAKK